MGTTLLGILTILLGIALHREGTSTTAGGVGDGTEAKSTLERHGRTFGWPVAIVGVVVAIAGWVMR